MGTLFDGVTEDLLLYWVIPGNVVFIALVLGALLFRVRTLLERNASSWEGRVEASSPNYRRAAKELAGAPKLVRRAANGLVVWGVLGATNWVVCLLLLAAASRSVVLVPLSALGLALAVQATRGGFDLTSRVHLSVPTHIQNSRVRIGVFQSIVACIGTALWALVSASTLFFWNSGNGQMMTFALITLAYAAFCLLPTLLGVWLFRTLRVIEPLYAASKESAAPAT